MTDFNITPYKGLPYTIKVRKPRYYYQDITEYGRDNYTRNIFLEPFTSLDYSFDNCVKFNKGNLWNRISTPAMEAWLAPYLGTEKYCIIDATIAGSPTITDDGIASNFSTSNYLTIPKKTISGSFEMMFKVKTPSSLPSGYVGITGQVSTNKTTPQLEYNDDGIGGIKILISTSSSSTWYGGSVFFPTTFNTWYWTKFVWSNGVGELLYSTNGKEFTSAGTFSLPSIYWSEDMAIGKDQKAFFTGSIDLKECYIKINGIEIWRGATEATRYKTYTTTVGEETVECVGSLDGVADVATEKTYNAFYKDGRILLSESSADKDGYTWAGTVTVPAHTPLIYHTEYFDSGVRDA